MQVVTCTVPYLESTVAAFMLVYYLLAGAVANAALMLNIVVLLGVLVLAGFAIVHALAARSASRMLLISTYLIVIVFGIPLLLLAIAGALEPWLRLRARFLSGAAPRA